MPRADDKNVIDHNENVGFKDLTCPSNLVRYQYPLDLQ
jgi:hypothetical protein